MSDTGRQRFESAQTYLFVGIVAAASLWLLMSPAWDVPAPWPSQFWNAIATFTILGIVSDSLSSQIPVSPVTTSVGFIPFIAHVALFPPPLLNVISDAMRLFDDV